MTFGTELTFSVGGACFKWNWRGCAFRHAVEVINFSSHPFIGILRSNVPAHSFLSLEGIQFRSIWKNSVHLTSCLRLKESLPRFSPQFLFFLLEGYVCKKKVSLAVNFVRKLSPSSKRAFLWANKCSFVGFCGTLSVTSKRCLPMLSRHNPRALLERNVIMMSRLRGRKYLINRWIHLNLNSICSPDHHKAE